MKARNTRKSLLIKLHKYYAITEVESIIEE